jgi:hypothetical protein
VAATPRETTSDTTQSFVFIEAEFGPHRERRDKLRARQAGEGLMDRGSTIYRSTIGVLLAVTGSGLAAGLREGTILEERNFP